jgi:CelD/BcsL family acetyltransferase involved in cellulose biosynthesis
MSGSGLQRAFPAGQDSGRSSIQRLDVEEVCDIARFEQLGDVWNRLLEQTGAPSVYLSHEWLLTWWKCHKSDSHRLLIIVVTEGDVVRGIAPLMEVRSRFFGIPVTRIEFISTMKYAYSPTNCSGSLDIIAPDPAEGVVRTVLDHLLRRREQWQFIRLHPIPRSSQIPGLLLSECDRRSIPWSRQTAFGNFVIRAGKSWEEYSAGRSPEFRKKHRTLERKAKRLGELCLVEYSRGGNLRKGFDKVLEIEEGSWKHRHGVPLDAEHYHGFYKRFAEVADPRGWLRLWILEVNGTPLAYDYSVKFADRLESLKTSYHAAYRRYSPGTLLSWRVFEYAFRDGIRSINLLWGDSWSKHQWTGDVEMHDELFIFNSTRFSRICYLLGLRIPLYRVTRSLANRLHRLLWRVGAGGGRPGMTT